LSPLSRWFTQNRAHTDPASEDHRLSGRTYAIPFDRVWTESVHVARKRMWGWTVTTEDHQLGVLEAESVTLILRFVDDVHVSVGLDDNGQTRVDVTSASRIGWGDLGRNPRTIGKFIRKLDRALDLQSGQILDPRLSASWGKT
jgi:uncharacterized protein (DUF1499 family)